MAREQQRVQFFIEVVLDSASGRWQARISDLSSGGCFIDSIATVREGEAVKFEVIHPGGKSLHFTGQVTYTLPGVGFGVRFTNVTEAQQKFADMMVRTLSKSSMAAAG